MRESNWNPDGTVAFFRSVAEHGRLGILNGLNKVYSYRLSPMFDLGLYRLPLKYFCWESASVNY